LEAETLRAKAIQAPPWLAWFLTPLIARLVAAQMAAKYPQLGAAEIGARMRAEIPSGSDARAFGMVDAVVARLPERGEASSEEVAKAFPASVWFLVAANLLPLYGVLAWGWEVFPLLALFWMENVMVGVLNVARMLCVDPVDAPLWLAKLFVVPFFCVHYGMFTFVHGLFVFSSMLGGQGYEASGSGLLGPALRAAHDFNLWLPLGALAASHLFSFFWNYLYRGEFRRAALSLLMMKPYARVMVLHVTILFGGLAAMKLGSPVWALCLLVGVKMAIDVHAHRKEHKAPR
jgi:Family of unknown function (DUF6498)